MKDSKNKTLFYTLNGFIALGFAVVAMTTVYFGNTLYEKGSVADLYSAQRPAASEATAPAIGSAPTSTSQGMLSLVRSNDASATSIAPGTNGALVGSWSAHAFGGDVTVKNLCLDVNPFPGNEKQLGATEVTHAKVIDLGTQEVLFESKISVGQLNGACEVVAAAKPFVVAQGVGKNIGLFVDVSTGAPVGAKFMPLLGLENASPSFVTDNEVTLRYN